MGKKVILFLISFTTWALLNWVPDWEHLLIGAAASVFVTFLVADLSIERPWVLKDPKRYFYFFVPYLPVVIWEVIKSNIDVAWRILHPSLPIRPGIVRVTTGLKNDIALTALANSITLTPGTLVVDIDRDKGVLYVHWIDVKSTETEAATKCVVERFEKVLRKIFD